MQRMLAASAMWAMRIGVEQAAGLHDLDVEGVAGLRPDELDRVGRAEQGLVGHDGDGALGADGPHAGMIRSQDGLLAELDGQGAILRRP